MTEDFLKMSIFNRFSKTYYTTLKEHLALTFDGNPATFEMLIDNDYYIFYTVPLIEENEQVTQILIIEKNITELKKAEEKIYKSLQKEKQLNELKSRFVSMASHEFRTPLSTILSSSSLIARYQNPEQQDKRDKHIVRIQSSVRNLTSILNDFLSLDKLEQGKIHVANSKFNIESFSKEIIEEIENILKQNQTILYQHIGTNEIELDENILKNICFNLLSNAIKYSDEDKQIFFETKIEENEVQIKVKDQGIGIPKQDQKYLFERFFRAQNVTNIQGTGLGLNIVQKYVDLLNGNIRFESIENQGTTFFITFKI